MGDNIWLQLRNQFNEDLLETAIDRSRQLEQLLRLVLTYKEAIDRGYQSQIARDAVFARAKELSLNL